MEKKIKYDIGTNFDPELINVINKYNGGKIFSSVFGKLRDDMVGGGRASMLLPEISLKQLEDYVKLCHENGVKFNYLLNPLCLGNKELEVGFHNELLTFLGQLSDIGVDGVTVNSPLLCEIVKKQFPKLRITIGVWANISSIQHIRYWEKLGAHELTLVREMSRDFKKLEKFLNYTKGRDTILRLFPNSLCLYNCPYSNNHAVGSSHATQKSESSFNLYIDHNITSCNMQRISNPVKFMSANWIRPEDIKYYEELCEKTGNYNLSMKLLDRTKNTAFLEKVIKAYATRNFEGNLRELFNYASAKENNVMHKEKMFAQAKEGGYNMEELMKFIHVFNLPDIYIDNKKLDGFMEKFVNSDSCGNYLCDDEGWGDSASKEKSGSCSYCRKWAEKAMSFDKEEVDKWLGNTGSFVESMRTSSVFQK